MKSIAGAILILAAAVLLGSALIAEAAVKPPEPYTQFVAVAGVFLALVGAGYILAAIKAAGAKGTGTQASGPPPDAADKEGG